MEVEALQKSNSKTSLLQKTKKQKPNREAGLYSDYFRIAENKLKKKRVLDLCILFFLSPIILFLCLITALLIKLDSRGPVLFIQRRVGANGKPFKMYKFRSMRIDSEKNGSKFATKNDERITNLGKFIRKFRIDEIPQFWNVLRGEMSIIGPRPEQVSFVDFFNEEIKDYDLRHSVKPGITGLAQVQQGYAASKRSTEMKLNYDLFYIRNYSLKMDLIIIGKTLYTIMTGFGAR